ncbi:MAG: hypothetical protein JRH08_10040 [Deltaproteobacteria bacterium]|nr:hypothetical protein [Deltaproteobacteria bacterium]MBW1928705.1 hypothetical protein [Deltaproteobacteria bacterium]MBW2025223.1 hypothetical protein [Deltaproteobacteria bacterium]MBW2126018.1 hypothetical protein [Deltaproteobacteria bacterium]RLB15441.1 MAG: hypothetical protein DRG63_06895 [Deltaproteobacteria bacterium]
MKIAIPLFKDRVAPHFGASSEILLVEIKDASLYQEAKWNLGGDTPLDIARRLVELGVDKIICGGISRVYKEWLVRKGISVEDNKRGEAKEIIKQLLSN